MSTETRRYMGIQRLAVSHLIVHEMRLCGYSRKALAEAIGISGQAVAKTLYGLSHSPRVLNKLREIGVQECLLFDPRAMCAHSPSDERGQQ